MYYKAGKKPQQIMIKNVIGFLPFKNSYLSAYERIVVGGDRRKQGNLFKAFFKSEVVHCPEL